MPMMKGASNIQQPRWEGFMLIKFQAHRGYYQEATP